MIHKKLQQKLDYINEIQEKIKNLYEDLELALGGVREPEAKEEPVKAYRKKENIPSKKPKVTSKRGKRTVTCSVCGKIGHMKPTCPGGEVKEKISKGFEKKKKEIGDILTESQYVSVLEAKDHDMNSKEIAENMEITVDQVNAVLASTSYELYSIGYKEREDFN